MSLKVVLYLTFVAVAVADEMVVSEMTKETVAECSAQENVTDEEISRFMRKEEEASPEMKDFLLCMTQKSGVFNGVWWNVEEIRKFVDDEERMKAVEECLKMDDKTKESRDRNYDVFMCCLEKDAFI